MFESLKDLTYKDIIIAFVIVPLVLIMLYFILSYFNVKYNPNLYVFGILMIFIGLEYYFGFMTYDSFLAAEYLLIILVLIARCYYYLDEIALNYK